MATNEEFDRGEAIDSIKGLANRARDIQSTLFDIARKYSNPQPTSDAGVEKYREELLRDLRGPFNAFRSLMDELD